MFKDLEPYLTLHLPGYAGPLRIEQFRGGQSNPTFLLEAGSGRYVLRKKPAGTLLPGAHQIEREYRVMHALRDTGVPLIPTRLLCEDAAVIGTPFYVMDFAEGRVFRDPSLPGHTPEGRRAIYTEMASVMARLHGVDWRAAGLDGFGKPTGYLARQIATWTRQYQASQTGPMPAMEALIAWLPAHIPADQVTTVAHGDFRLENLMFHATEPRVLGVLDWELATLGHPLADLAYNCMGYHMDPATPGFGGLLGCDLGGLGIPTEAEYLQLYATATGRPCVSDYPFFLAFGCFRFTSILQGVYARSLAGNASQPEAAQYGTVAPMFAELGWAAAEGRVALPS